MSTQREYSVFLVDDDKMFLASLKNNLKRQFGSAIKVSEYGTGEECMDYIYKFQPADKIPDIVILDYYFNDAKHPEAIDGLKVLRKLKSISDDIVVIMLSGQDKLQVAIDCLKNGAHEYIAKSETTHFNTQNALKSAMEIIQSTRENNNYLKWNRYMGLFIISMILLDIIWHCALH